MYALLLAKNSFLIALGVIQSLADKGIKSVVITNEGNEFLGSLAASRAVHKLFVVPDEVFLADYASLTRVIREACARYNIAMLLSADIDSTYFLCERRHEISEIVPLMPLPEPATFQILNNKWRLARLLDENGISQPHTVLIETPFDLQRKYYLPAFPVLTKPLDWNSGNGIQQFQDIDSLDAYVSEIAGAPDNQRMLPLVVQEFVPGEDIDLSVLCREGHIIAWTVQKQAPGGMLEFDDRSDVLEVGKRIISISGYTGIAHIDMRVDARDLSIKVIECNPRFWGTIYASCIAGVNFPALCLDFDYGLNGAAREVSGQVTVTPLRKAVKALLGGACVPTAASLRGLATALRQETIDQLPHLVRYLQRGHPELAGRIGRRFVQRKREPL